jgi:flagellar M-ring protein FliF
VTAVVTLAVVLAGLAWLGFFLLSQDYAVLFSDLNDADAASIVAQLKKTKTPYRLSNDGTSISVPADHVHETRLGMMTSDLPLSGGVGFEIFDKQGLGATEQSQRVSYQRALQGELARTIGALENVKHVRVHLVMPESTLFTRDKEQATAAVAVTMRAGAALVREQISGIQRLVAAAVPGLAAGQVVVTDQRGITLSATDSGSVSESAEARLEMKRQVEEYVAHKIVRLLDGAFGPGQAIVSVDASLNFDATKTTIRDLLPVKEGREGEGHIVRRRQVTGAAMNDPVWTAAVDGAAAPTRNPGSSSEVEYEYGQRIDEIVAGPGALTRLSVGVIVPGEVDAQRRDRITELVGMAAGINRARGDAVSVQSLEQMQTALPDTVADAQAPTSVQTPEPDGGEPDRTDRSRWPAWLPMVAVVCLIVAMLGLLLRGRPSRRLSASDRERILAELQQALADEPVPRPRP